MSTDPPRQPPSRRDFLTGGAALRAVQDAAAQAVDRALDQPAEERPAPSYVLHVGRPAMACEFEILLNAGQHPYGPEVALRALDLVDQLEDQLTVYRSHSEVSRLNDAAFDEPVLVERRLFALLELAVRLYGETDGAVDITAGPLVKVWGFYRRAGRVPTNDELQAALERTGARHLQLDPAAQTVRFLRPGLEINLGAIGKGYALDRCAELLAEEGIENYMLHGGTSSILARGSRAGSPVDSPGWTVALRHPLRPDQKLAEIRLRDRALGTSGSGQQFFFHQGRRYGHILDPRTGRPAEAVLSATVTAPTAAEADALATAFYVLGPIGAKQYCDAHPEISALLVEADPRSAAVKLHDLNSRPGEFRIEGGGK